MPPITDHPQIDAQVLLKEMSSFIYRQGIMVSKRFWKCPILLFSLAPLLKTRSTTKKYPLHICRLSKICPHMSMQLKPVVCVWLLIMYWTQLSGFGIRDPFHSRACEFELDKNSGFGFPTSCLEIDVLDHTVGKNMLSTQVDDWILESESCARSWEMVFPRKITHI